jgi:7-cyano-7-deazaguanine synthase in queuosine biosynthesis
MNKNILQAVSGGYDSTYLMIKNLETGDNVYPIYIRASSVNGIKQHIEYHNVKNIIQAIQKEYPNLHDFIETTIRQVHIENIFSSQPLLWMLELFSEVKNKQNYVDYDEVHIGYIMNDSAFSYLSEILSFWKSLFSFSYPGYDYSIPKLLFPLKKLHKETILSRLRNYNSSILYSCWTCEMPKTIKTKNMKDSNVEVLIEPCGECKPCLNIKNSHIINFDSLTKYKAVIHAKEYRSQIKSIVNESPRSKLRGIEDFSLKSLRMRGNKSPAPPV